MKVFYFTGTGNSLAVAKRIGGELLSIPQEMRKEDLSYEDEAIGLVFPEYYGSPPHMVREFIAEARFQTGYLFAIITCGSGAGGIFAELQDIANRSGLQFDYLNALVMVDNFLPVFEIGAEVARLPEKRTEECLAAIADDIRNRRAFAPPVSAKAKAMLAFSKGIMGKMAGKYSSAAFSVTEACTLCGTCASVCPTANVTVGGKVAFGGNCESCYACIHACPAVAIHIPGEKSARRFRNPEVSLHEIVAANDIRARTEC